MWQSLKQLSNIATPVRLSLPALVQAYHLYIVRDPFHGGFWLLQPIGKVKKGMDMLQCSKLTVSSEALVLSGFLEPSLPALLGPGIVRPPSIKVSPLSIGSLNVSKPM